MRKQFIKLSALRSKAKEDVQSHVESWDKKKKILNTVIGTAATNKDWFISAQKKYSASMQKTGFEKITFLVSALYDSYKCLYRMDYSRFNDSKIQPLINKIETSYLNTIIEFIENNIHDNNLIERNMPLLTQGIKLLAEENSKLANGYKARIKHYQSMLEAVDSIAAILNTPAGEFTQAHAIKIKNLFTYQKKNIHRDNELQESITIQINDLMEEIYIHHKEMLQEEDSKRKMSIRRKKEIINQFESLYLPLKFVVYSKRYQTFINQKNEMEAFIKFIDKEFPEFKKMYDYLSFPRTTLDTKKILDLYHNLELYKDLYKHPYIELEKLKPTLPEIEERYENALSEYYKRDLINYYKIFNEIINADENELKISEMIRFNKHLTDQISSNKHTGFVLEKLSNMREEIRDDLYEILDRKLSNELQNAKDDKTIKKAFDDILEKFMDLGDIDRIEELQKKKKSLLNKKREAYSKGASQPEDKQILPPRLVILDKFSLRNYVIFTQDYVTIGRNEINDIIIRSDWVSGKHCKLDFDQLNLIDESSTNGTYINGGKDKIKISSIKEIAYFNVAQKILFSIHGFSSSFHLKLQRILDDKLLSSQDNINYVQSLLNTEFVRLDKNNEFTIHKITGNINGAFKDLSEAVLIKFKKGNFYFTDQIKGIVDKKIEYTNESLSERFAFTLS